MSIEKHDEGKPRPTLVPRAIIWAISEIRGYGIEKYPDGGENNWKRVSAERYRDAAFRHFLAYLDDPYGADTESGFPHLWHLATNIAFLCELDRDKFIEELERKINDDNDNGSHRIQTP